MTHKHTTDDMPLLDLIFCMLMFFVLLWVIQINKQKKDDSPVDANIISKAEYIVEIEWPLDNPDDVDIFLEDPVGNLINYQMKSRGFMHVDRDDRGSANDKIRTVTGVVTLPINREIITLRGTIDGWYIFNIHMYHKNCEEPTDVSIHMVKLNPYSVIMHETFTLEHMGEEFTIMRFNMKNGYIIETNQDQKRFVTNKSAAVLLNEMEQRGS